MPIPQVTDRIKEAPAVVLRAVFAGIGQLLMAVDKIRAQMEQDTAPAEADQKAPNGTQPPRRQEETGNVTVLRDRTAATTATRPAAPPAAAGTHTAPATTAAPKPAATPKPAAAPKPTAAPGPVAPEGRPAAPGPAAEKPAAPAPAAAQAPPIPGYDDLSIASLRARLRGLDADGVRALLAYEKANARRDDVITMFERRISKLEDEAG